MYCGNDSGCAFLVQFRRRVERADVDEDDAVGVLDRLHVDGEARDGTREVSRDRVDGELANASVTLVGQLVLQITPAPLTSAPI